MNQSVIGLLLLLRSVWGNEYEYVLDFAPVLDSSISPSVIDTFNPIALQPKESDTLTLGDPQGTCPESDANAPFGLTSTFATKSTTYEGWKFRLSAPEGYYLKGDKPPKEIKFDIRFGGVVDCDDNFGKLTSDVSLVKAFDIDKGKVRVYESSYENNNCGLLQLEVILKSETDCVIFLDESDHTFVFSVPEKLLPYEYLFEPCFASMEVVEGPNSLTFAEKSRRLAEESTDCPYCTELPCPCCPSPETTSEVNAQNDKPSGIAIAGVTLAAISTALTLAILVFLVATQTAR